jgi:hypothetical protein
VAPRVLIEVALIINLLGLVQVVRGGRQSGLIRTDRFYTRIAYVIEAPIQLTVVANVLALFPGHLTALYLAFLVLLLCQAGVVFIGLLASLFDPPSASSQ